MITGWITVGGSPRMAGFALTESLVLTAAHGLRDADPRHVLFHTSLGEVAISELRIADELDIALLSTTAKLTGTAVAKAARQQRWRVVSQPRENDPQLTGVITEPDRRVRNAGGQRVRLIQLSVDQLLADYRGYSGSAIISDDPDNAVIGVLVEQVRERTSPERARASNVLFAVPIESILERFHLDLGPSSGILHRLPGMDEEPPPSGSEDRAVDDWDARSDVKRAQRDRRVALATVEAHADELLAHAHVGHFLPTTFRLKAGRVESHETIEAIFGRADSLVVLSPAGLGKTTQLARLTKSLACAEGAAQRALPFLLNLSTYRGGELDQWMAEEINRTYLFHADQAWVWIRSELGILPILDGLDEVPEQHRQECAHQVAARAKAHRPFVLSCRDRDATLARATAAQIFIEIAPPKRDEVRDFLAKTGALSDVSDLLDHDRSLWELLQSPLMLNIILHTYADRPAVELRRPASTEERRKLIFDAYLRRMLDRPSRYSTRKTVQWLSWLAWALGARGERVFYLDRLDGSWLWLTDPRISLSLISVEGSRSSTYLPPQVTELVVEDGDDEFVVSLRRSRWSIRAKVLCAVVALGIALGVGTVVALWQLGHLSNEVAAAGWVLLAVYPLSVGIRLMGTLHERLLERGEGPVERVTWSLTWLASRTDHYLKTVKGPAFKRIMAYHVVVNGMAPVVTISTVALILNETTQMITPGALLLLGALEITLSERLTPHMTERRARPNEGIHRSLKYCLAAFTGFCMLFAALSTVLITLTAPELPFVAVAIVSITIGTIVGLARGMGLGGYAVIAHLMIRRRMRHTDAAPWRYRRFLDDAEKRILLRRTGSGYAFPHRLMQEHLAVPAQELMRRLAQQPHDQASAY